MVTTRSSGSSFLNRVELQNGCLSRGHSNLFIPSTLSGSCIEDGEINNDILCKNLNLAIDTYISYINKAPCGSTVIHLYKGADSTDHHMYRENLKIFFKGPRQRKRPYDKKIHLSLNTSRKFGKYVQTIWFKGIHSSIYTTYLLALNLAVHMVCAKD